jgi:hypothetical protein
MMMDWVELRAGAIGFSLVATALFLSAGRAAEPAKSVIALEKEAEANVEARITPEMVAERLGVQWPPPKTAKTRAEVEAAVKVAVERAAGGQSEDELRKEAGELYSPWEKGDRVSFRVNTRYNQDVEGIISEIYPHMVKVGGRWVRMSDVDDDVKAHFDDEIRQKRIEVYVRKALLKQEREQTDLRAEQVPAIAGKLFAEAGFHRVRGKWYTGEELRRTVESYVARKRREGLPGEVRRLMDETGYVRYGGRWAVKEGAVKAMEEHRKSLVDSGGGGGFGSSGGGAPSLKLLSDSIVLVKSEMGSGESAQGTGFIVFLDGSEYLVTNQHVIVGADRCRFMTVGGAHLRPTSFEFHPSLDLVRMGFDVSGSGVVRPLLPAPSAPDVGHDVYVYGNSEGAEVATALSGKVQGLAPDRLEVSAQFVEGNSGSPIIDGAGRVVGVATYALIVNQPTELTKDTRFSEPRRFGLRLQDSTPFSLCDVRTFMSQGQLLSDLGMFLEDVLRIFAEGAPFMEAYSLTVQGRRYHDLNWAKRVHYLIHQKGFLKITDPGQITPDQAKQLIANIAEAMAYEINLVRKTVSRTDWATGYLADDAQQGAQICGVLVTLMGMWKGEMVGLINRATGGGRY